MISTPQPEEQEQKELKPAAWKTRIEACKGYRRKLVSNWTVNVDYRRAKPFPSQSDQDRILVPLDWPMVKAKEAGLFSRVPQVRVDHAPQTFVKGSEWVHAFEQRLNDTLVTAGIETAMEECLPDCINAAGFGAVIVSYEVLNEQVEMSTVDLSTYPPDVAAQIEESGMMPDGSPIPMTTVPRPVDKRYKITRISPSDFLWPVSFTGADFDNSPWIGRSGRCSWSQAVQMFGLKEEDRTAVCGDNKNYLDRLSHDIDKDKVQPEDIVPFDEIFYKDCEFDEKAKSYSTIHRLVFVNGKDEPVIDEAWKGQKNENNTITGSSKFPIRILTLAYLTDDAIPPSDSAIARSQINEINESRSQMILQRKRSMPIRWFNNDRMDSTIAQAMMRGVWQAAIPVQGDGTNIIGEVGRSAHPPENFTFMDIATRDLEYLTGVGPNQNGGFGQGRQSATESSIVQDNYSTRNAKDRSKTVKFVCGIAEVIGGLLSLFEAPESFGQGFDPSISQKLSYSILADSTVILDTNTRREMLKDFINFTAKSGFVDIETVLKEYATLSGLDPNLVIKPPQPKPPVEPTISLRFTGVEDLMNPLVLAFLMKSGQMPEPQLIEDAKRAIQQAITPPNMGPNMQGQAQGMPGAPPTGDPNAPPPPQGLAGPGGPMAEHILPAPAPPPTAAVPAVGEAHPNWGALDRINKRVMNQE